MSEPKIVLYHYPYSPYARRVLWYLALRGLPFTQCVQPPVMPRPDVAALGVSYRRIPVMAVGRDVFCDSRLQLRALDALFPPSPAHPSLAVHGPEARAIASLTGKWVVDGGLFARGAALIPPDLPAMKDPTFQRDREEFSGRSWKRDDLVRARPEALVHVREAFDILEALLGDGREWLCCSAAATVADIEAVWLVHWLTGMKGALDEEVVSAGIYPRVFAWRERFDAATKAGMKAQKAQSLLATLDGPQAAQLVLGAAYAADVHFDDKDPLRLKKGERVEVYPTDSGSTGKDSGELIGLDRNEIVIETTAADGKPQVRIHFPRSNFRVIPLGQSRL